MDPRKDSVLDKDAEIFQKRDENKFTGKNKKSLTKEEKKKIFLQYYLWKIVIATVIVGVLIGVIIKNILYPEPKYKLQVEFLANTFDEGKYTESVKDELIDYLELDKEKETVIYENLGSIADESTAQIKFTTLCQSGDADIVVTTQEKYKNNFEAGLYCQMDQYLTDDMKKFFEDRVVYETADDGQKYIMGIKIDQNSKWYSEIGGAGENIILSAVCSSEDQDMIEKFLQYFYEKEKE